ncbi:MAG: hypothetical protein AB7I18_00235 [Candidatus Berkiella sp.]
MTENIDDFLILPVSALDEMLAKSPSEQAHERPISCLTTPSEFSYIDEHGLLPGSSEAKTIMGFLSDSFAQAGMLHFAPIASQLGLHDLKLKANGTELSYLLDESRQHLIGTVGEDTKIFDAEIKQDGTYCFTLHHPIDRLSAPNLVTDIWQTVNEENTSRLMQQIETQANLPYQFTLHFLPGLKGIFDQLQVYWDHQLLQSIKTSEHDASGYTFSVEGAHGDHTLLEIVGIGGAALLTDYIQNISVASTSQFQLPIDFSVLFTGDDNNVSQSGFTINVTTTPAIEIGNQNHLDIFYEQSVYQSIIVSDENAKDNPLATINLDTLFKQLAIDHDNRLVEVVQRIEDGLGTNVYDIKVSDKAHAMEPITIADVQLSFPGGDGGMAVFERHIAIDEGSTSIVLPPFLDLI